MIKKIHIECSESHKKFRASLIKQTDNFMEVELLTGAKLKLDKFKDGVYKLLIGNVEFFFLDKNSKKKALNNACLHHRK